jgi:hypothetical protein
MGWNRFRPAVMRSTAFFGILDIQMAPLAVQVAMPTGLRPFLGP